MARSGGSSGRGRQQGRQNRSRRSNQPQGVRATNPPARPHAPQPEAPTTAADELAPFVLGVIPGATPGKWVDTWRERMPRTPIVVESIDVAGQRERLLSGDLDAALVRLPLNQDDLHVIPLYDEIAVVVTSSDSSLTAADELDLSDLVDEVVIVPRDDVYALTVPGSRSPAFDAPADTGEAISTVAAGVGVVIVPMSLARAHARKDVTSRPLRDGPSSTVALAWPSNRTTPGVEAFVGIVRGRTANSSRG